MTRWSWDAARPWAQIPDLVRARAHACGSDLVAADLADGRLSARDLDQGADALCAELDSLAGPAGLVVARLPNCLAAVVAVVGVLRSRHALLMVHPELPDEVCDSALGRLGPVAEVVVAGGALRVVPEPYGPGCAIWAPPAGRPDLGIALCVLTSGTTGRPRVIAAPHRQVGAAVRLISSRLAYRHDDVVPVISPLSFDYGLYQLFLAFVGGSRLIIDPRLASVSNVLVAIARSGVTVLPLVPTMLRAITSAPFVKRVDTSRVRLITTTGDLLTEADADAAAACFANAAIVPMYGLSECKRVAVTTPGSARPAGAIGLPLDNTDVAVVDASGARVRAGVGGELVVAGPHLTLGYLADQAATAKRFAVDPRSGVRLLRTGDRLRGDDDGWLYWVGRSNDLIKTSGYRIDPAEIETAAAASGVVDESGAYGQSDPDRGQVPVLRVRLRAGVSPDSGRAAIGAAIARALPPWAVPRIEVSDEPLPYTANGKIDRAALNSTGPRASDGETAPSAPPGPGPLAATVAFPRSANLVNCHTQALLSAFTLPDWVTPALFEIATTVPFGTRTVPADPHRVLIPWLDPDLGLDRAAHALGLDVQTAWHDDADAAITQLDGWLRTSPVVLGPLDLGELDYHELAGTLRGCDHYVVALGRPARGDVIVRDPEGYAEIAISEPALRRAWAAVSVPEGRGGFMLRRLQSSGGTVAQSEVVARVADGAIANLAAAAARPDGGASGYRSLAAANLDQSGRRGLSLLLPSAAGRARLAARFAALAVTVRPDAARFTRLATLWDEQVKALALAHAALLGGEGFADYISTAADLDELLVEVATDNQKANLR
jgi:acyl-CoA synthetase (AMP-forming)/AMP-acid ligase II